MGYQVTIVDATIEAFAKVEDIEDKSYAFVFVGQMVKDEECEAIVEALSQKYPHIEIGLIAGKQDVYDLLIGLY